MKIFNLIDSILTESHYSDIYSEEFDRFREKYLEISKSKRRILYVQFSNHASDPLERTPYPEPGHHDPAGVYGYPMDYVLKHPADVWYGSSAKYLRVLEDESKHKVILSGLNKFDIKKYLHEMDIGYPDDLLKMAKNEFPDRVSGTNKMSKAFFQVVQYDFDKGKIRSNVEQTKLLQKAGIDAIEDTSKSIKSAIINDREPEQIVFLNRYAFSVKEVFNLRGESMGTGTTIRIDDKQKRKLVAMIAEGLGDRLDSGPERGGGGLTFWTHGGRRIFVKFWDSSVGNRGLGEKPHRKNKETTPHVGEIEVYGPHGEFKIHVGMKDKFDDIVSKVVEAEKNRPPDPEWEPDSVEKYKEREEERKQKMRRDNRRKNEEEMIDKWSWRGELIKDVSDEFNIPFEEPKNEDEIVGMSYVIKEVWGHIFRNLSHIKEPISDDQISDMWDSIRKRYLASERDYEYVEKMKPIISFVVKNAHWSDRQSFGLAIRSILE